MRGQSRARACRRRRMEERRMERLREGGEGAWMQGRAGVKEGRRKERINRRKE